jgi:hypothetical protein
MLKSLVLHLKPSLHARIVLDILQFSAEISGPLHQEHKTDCCTFVGRYMHERALKSVQVSFINSADP